MPEIHKFSQAAIKVTSLSHGFTADTTFTNYIALIRSPIVEAVFFFFFFLFLFKVRLVGIMGNKNSILKTQKSRTLFYNHISSYFF